MVSIVLVIADVPLSMKLTADGFDLEVTKLFVEGWAKYQTDGMVLAIGLVSCYHLHKNVL